MKIAVPAAFGAATAVPRPQDQAAYAIDAQASGIVETLNNISNLTVVSKDANDLRAEYRAGFVQGKLQAAGLRGLNDGQKVSYEVVMERGKAAATNLKLS